MSVTEHERALAVMDDDGWGAAITTTDEERETRDILGDLGTMLAVSEGLEDGSLTEDDAGNWTRRQSAAEPAPALRWYTSVSADDENHDQEVNLDKAGNPGGAVWASVSPNSQPGYGPWVWVIYDRWLDVDEEPDPTLADGPAASEEAAKVAVAEWVRAATEGK
jgi:hypothetical protein